MGSAPMIVCRSCGARIQFAETEKGRRMPVDARPNEKGNLHLIVRSEKLPIAVVLNKEAAETYKQEMKPLYVSHFVTCPAAAAHRKRKQLDKERRQGHA